jgi:purine-binding chemotaxis protein CheW
MEAHDRHELLTRLARLERELLFVRRKLKEQQTSHVLPEGSFQAVRIQLGVGEFAIPSECVRQIIRYARPAQVGSTAGAIKGLLRIGGEAIIVLDLAERIGLGASVIDDDSALLIARLHDSLVALIIERVQDAILLQSCELHVPSIQLAPNACVAAVGTYAGRLVQVLDVDRLVSPSELEQLTRSTQRPGALPR